MTIPARPGTYKVPFTIGESLHKNIPAGQRSSLPLAAGRWALSPRSMVPYATVDAAAWGVREMTWGQLIEVPEGSQGAVTNTSFHQGDIVFDGAGTGVGYINLPPATVTVPAIFATDPAGGVGALKTMPVDTRRARRIYLCIPQSYIFGPIFACTAHYIFSRRGIAFSPAAVVVGGEVQDVITQFGYVNMIPLGLASGRNQEPAPGTASLMELRPMAMFDGLYLTFTPAEAAVFPIGVGTNAYFLLEY